MIDHTVLVTRLYAAAFVVAHRIAEGAPNAEVRRALSDFETAVANLRGAAEVYMIENTRPDGRSR